MPEQFRLTQNNQQTIRSTSFSTANPRLYTDPEAQELFRVSGDQIIEITATSPIITDIFTKENEPAEE